LGNASSKEMLVQDCDPSENIGKQRVMTALTKTLRYSHT